MNDVCEFCGEVNSRGLYQTVDHNFRKKSACEDCFRRSIRTVIPEENYQQQSAAQKRKDKRR